MKTTVLLVLVLGVLGVGVFAWMKSRTGGFANVERMTPMEAMGMISNEFGVLVDVREKDEVQLGMAQPAHWIPKSKIDSNSEEWQAFLAETPKDKKLIFYCAVGGRAGTVASAAAQMGFKTANMGGFKDWKAAGLPVKTGGH